MNRFELVDHLAIWHACDFGEAALDKDDEELHSVHRFMHSLWYASHPDLGSMEPTKEAIFHEHEGMEILEIEFCVVGEEEGNIIYEVKSKEDDGDSKQDD